MRKKESNNLINFILYFSYIISTTLFLLFFLTLKNECINNEIEIANLNKEKMHNTNIVKELQSKKEYLLSENHISNALSKKMIAVAPETLIVNINFEQWENFLYYTVKESTTYQ